MSNWLNKHIHEFREEIRTNRPIRGNGLGIKSELGYLTINQEFFDKKNTVTTDPTVSVDIKKNDFLQTVRLLLTRNSTYGHTHHEDPFPPEKLLVGIRPKDI